MDGAESEGFAQIEGLVTIKAAKMKEKNENYFGSKLNELVHYTCKKNMVVNNIDMIFRYYNDNNKLRVVESKHLGESIKKGQKNILKQFVDHNIESFVVFGNPPYDNSSFVYSLHTYNLYKVNKKILVSFFNNEIQEEGLSGFFVRNDEKLIKLYRNDYDIVTPNLIPDNVSYDWFEDLTPPAYFDDDFTIDMYCNNKEEQKQIHNSNSGFEEKDIVRILMLFGSLNFQIDQKGTIEEWDVATYVLSNMEDVIGEFEHPLYRRIVRMIYEHLCEEKTYTLEDFLRHEDKEIQRLAIDLSNSPHEYSEDWIHKFDKPLATQSMPNENFKTDAMTGVNLFKLKKNQRLYEKNQRLLKDIPKNDFDSVMRLLKVQQRLMDIRKELAHLTGTQVLN